MKKKFIATAALTCALFVPSLAQAQVTLTGSSYTENFNAIGGGLPPGFTVRTGANSSALGTSIAFTTPAIDWSNSGGGFRNFASTISNEGTNYNGLEPSAIQTGSTNRSLGIRQTGSVGDPGGSFVFQIADTVGITGVQLAIDFNMLSVQTRSTIWTTEYATGAVPTSFTTIGTTYTDPGVFGVTPKTFNFGSALDNLNTPVWIRITALTASATTGSRDSFGIDNFVLTYTSSGGVAPNITSQPQGASAYEGASTNFSVIATGVPAPTYQWRSNTVNIVNATNATLAFVSATTNDAADYTVVLTNPSGSVTSSIAHLTVLLATPIITDQPQSIGALAGEDVTFTVTAAGAPTLTYQWRKDGIDISGATTSSLVFSNVLAADAGSFTCFVTNNTGTALSEAGVLTVSASFVTVMHYNVKGNGVVDFSTNTAQVQAIGRQLVYLNPDIISFNEIPFNQTHQVANIVSNYLPGYYYATNSGSDNFIRSAIVSRWPITRSAEWLDGADLDSYGYTTTDFTRDLFEAEIDVPGFALPLHVFTTHLKSSSGGYTDSANKRAAEAAAITNFFTTNLFVLYPNHPYLLTGDMNEDDTNALAIQRLISGPSGLYLTNPTNSISGSGNTFSIQASLNGRLDYIFPAGTLFSNILSSQVFRTDLLSPMPPGLQTNDSATASDHLPVLMVFSNPDTASPTILTQPSSVTNTAGTTANLTVEVSGATPLVYKWSKNAIPLTDSGNISGSSSATLSISGVLASDAGNYSVTITNFAGSTNSADAILTVIDPYIASHPTSLTINPGSNAVFAVTASGTSPVTYQWRKSGVDLLEGGTISGATTASLTLSGATTNDNGSYSVLVSNAVGTALSSNAFLNVRTPPTITSQPASRTNNAGTTATFSVTATGSSLSYQWLKDGTPLIDGGLISGATASTLTVNNVFATDAGNYSVVVSNVVEVVTSSNAVLTVIDPAIATQPKNATVALGGTTNFSVVVTGSGIIGYQWKKNGNDLTDGGSISGATTSTLTINGASVADGGIYSVVVTGVSNLTSANAVLSVTTTTGELFLTGAFFSENFNSMGTTTGLPGGWKTSPAATAAPIFQAAGNFNFVTQVASSGSPTAGGRYNWGNGTNASDRAVGFMTSGSYSSPNSVMAGFVNDTGTNITGLDLSFDIERYRTNTAAAAVTFFLSTDGTNWTAYTSGDSGAFDTGTSAYSFTGGTVVSRSFSIAGLSIVTNIPFYLRWNINTTGTSSQGLGLDNVSLAATFNVTTTITVLTQPQSQSVWENANATLTVAASGTPPLGYQWSFNGNPISGQTTTALTLLDVTTNDSGSYFVTVTNDFGSTNSDTAVLTVQQPILTNIAYLRSLVENVNWLPTDTTNIYRVEATVITHTNISGPADASFYIQDNTAGIPVFVTGGSSVRPNAGDVVRVTGSLGHFNGLLQFANSAANPTHNVTILSSGNPLPAPTLLELNASSNTALIELIEGSRVIVSNVFLDLTSATFSTNTTIKTTNANNLAETFDLRIDARVGDFQGQTKPTNAVNIIGVLGQFDNSNPRNSGYQLLPTRFVDVIEAVEVDPPTIVTSPESISTLDQGSDATFTVVAAGIDLSYQWDFENISIPGATGASVTITNVTALNVGTYTITVSNGGGSTNVSANLNAVTADGVVPAVKFLSPGYGKATNAGVVSLSGTAVDKKTAGVSSGIIKSVKYSLNGAAVAEAILSAAAKPAETNWATAPVTLLPGTNTLVVTAYDLAGNASPASSKTVFYYDTTSTLTVQLNNDGAPGTNGTISGLGAPSIVHGTQFQLLVGRPFILNALVPKGVNYVFTNWGGGFTNVVAPTFAVASKLTFVMESNMVISANFITNPFAQVVGKHNGLFAETSGVAFDSAGLVYFKVSDKSGYSGKVYVGGDKLSISGKFDASGEATKVILRTKQGKTPLTLFLKLKWYSGSDEFEGTLTDGTFTSVIEGDRLVYDGLSTHETSYNGRYTMLIPRTNYPGTGPGGHGHGLITNSTAGIVALTGNLGDGEKIVQKVGLSKSGEWPLFVQTYKSLTVNAAKSETLGILIGNVGFTTNTAPPVGDLIWIKKEIQPSNNLVLLKNKNYYPGGFSNEVALIGSPYVIPGELDKAIDFVDGTVTFSDGELAAPLSTNLTVTPAKILLPKSAEKFVVQIKKTTGQAKFSFLDAAAGLRKAEGFGAVLQNSTNAQGYFQGTNTLTGTNHYGQVLLEGNP